MRRLPPRREAYRLTNRGRDLLTLLVLAGWLLAMGVVGGIETGHIL